MSDVNAVKITTTKTAKISGSGALTAVNLKEFADQIPPSANISISESKPYPGEYGSGGWSLTATWNE